MTTSLDPTEGQRQFEARVDAELAGLRALLLNDPSFRIHRVRPTVVVGIDQTPTGERIARPGLGQVEVWTIFALHSPDPASLPIHAVT